jgi:hypothetical protein
MSKYIFRKYGYETQVRWDTAHNTSLEVKDYEYDNLDLSVGVFLPKNRVVLDSKTMIEIFKVEVYPQEDKIVVSGYKCL